MIPIFDAMDAGREYKNQWVVLDSSMNVRDHGPFLDELQEKYGPSQIYYFIPAL